MFFSRLNSSINRTQFLRPVLTRLPQVAAPVFDPLNPGYFLVGTDVTITSATPGATIRYTVDGSTPTSSHGTVYSGPVTITEQTTLKAIAYDGVIVDSPVVSGTYYLLVQAPTFSPGSGQYSDPQTVTISTATVGASIRYTTDGSDPTPSTGSVYSTPITVSTTETVRAIAYKSNWIDSSVSLANYSIGAAVIYVLTNDATTDNLCEDDGATELVTDNSPV